MDTLNFVDTRNAGIYEDKFSKGLIDHEYPNVNTVRISKAFYPKSGKVLDYGFGYTQEVIHFLKRGYEVWGLDVSQSAVKTGYQKLKKFDLNSNLAHLESIDPQWNKLPYVDNFFDVVHSNQAIYFLADQNKIKNLLQEFKRVLKPQGKFSISTMGPENSFCSQGTKVGENLYRPNQNDDAPTCYVFPNENALRDAFSIFEIVEVGSFNNVYCGTNGFHWVVIGRNKK